MYLYLKKLYSIFTFFFFWTMLMECMFSRHNGIREWLLFSLHILRLCMLGLPNRHRWFLIESQKYLLKIMSIFGSFVRQNTQSENWILFKYIYAALIVVVVIVTAAAIAAAATASAAAVEMLIQNEHLRYNISVLIGRRTRFGNSAIICVCDRRTLSQRSILFTFAFIHIWNSNASAGTIA